MRYIIFAFDQYYPSGGCGDIVDVKKTEEKAFKKARKIREGKGARYGAPDYIEVYDIETGHRTAF